MRKGDLQSRTIEFLRFPLIVLVVLLHSYTSTRSNVTNDEFPVYRFVSFLFSLEIAQIAVPAFFFISGYLFFFKQASYAERLRKHAKTLLVPYLFWNAAVLALYACLENIPAFRGYFSGINEPISSLSPIGLLREFWDGGSWNDGNGTPILHQFWYIRNLILLGILSPVVAWYVRHTKMAGVAALILLWMCTPGMAFPLESSAFFAFGAYFSVNGKDFLPPMTRYLKPLGILFVALLIVNMALRPYWYFLPLDRAGFLCGLIFFIGAGSKAVEHGLPRRIPFLAQATFFILALHEPVLTLLKRMAIRFCSPVTDFSLTVIYFIAPAAVICFCLGVYALLRRYAPGVLGFMTGHRQLSKN